MQGAIQVPCFTFYRTFYRPPTTTIVQRYYMRGSKNLHKTIDHSFLLDRVSGTAYLCIHVAEFSRFLKTHLFAENRSCA